uniref:protein-glutamine gamma-glutamyltransferase n=1 Tax=Geotrypetes seraphini TaxID=260995 RepID=A0A6P8NNK0_GEOSA|nr:protein-glutamine gamma-glutamyltransferase 5-like [Geotrypetes seraphini]
MAQGLEVAGSDLQCYKNNLKHHTADISTKRLILRRGALFTIKLQFQAGGYLEGSNQIAFTVEIGPWPDEASGRKVTFYLASSTKPKSWSAVLESKGPNSMLISIFIPGNAIIGQYSLKVHVFTKNTPISYLLGRFDVLFNPWSPEDDVYLADDKQRDEYVLNEYGFVYQGNENRINPCAWNFGQFEEDILDICLKLLDKNLNFTQDAFKDMARRNDPVYVSRVVCAMINCNDDAGVLEGNWSGKFDNGVSPSVWNGSVTILRDWYAKDCQPVRYGQCWVYAAVMCTVMRCLGIPSRVITNFNSAHDSNANLFIENFIDNTGKKIQGISRDSIWNFHVWTECWMERRDLPPNYGGWQVLDPTPQERSNGIFCCGPASVKAIKEGDIQFGYDAPFVFAMVNADRITWVASAWGQEKYLCEPHSIGTKISTKCVGCDEREEVTDRYKHPEGSQLERKIFEKAVANLKQIRHSNAVRSLRPSSERMANIGSRSVSPAANSEVTHDQNKPQPNRPLSDAQIFLRFRLTKSPQIGENICLVLVAANLGFDSKKIKLHLSGQSMQHEGIPLQQFWKNSMYVDLGPSEEKNIEYTIPYSMYGKSLDDNNLIQVIAVGEDNQSWKKLLVVKDIDLETPPVLINVRGQAVVNQQLPVEFMCTNPLFEPVDNCELVIEGNGLLKRVMAMGVRPMKPRETIMIPVMIHPFKFGTKHLQANFSCNKFKNCKGYKNIVVACHGV